MGSATAGLVFIIVVVVIAIVCFRYWLGIPQSCQGGRASSLRLSAT